MKNRIMIWGLLAIVLCLWMPNGVRSQDASNFISDFAVVGYSSVSTAPKVKVLAGSSQARIGSNGSLCLRLDNRIGTDVDGGSLQALGDMRIGPRSEIYGDVSYNGTLRLAFEGTAFEPVIHGLVFPDQAMEIEQPDCEVAAPGGEDLILGWRETRVFEDGDHYGNVSIGPKSTLVFPTGVYSFQSLYVGPGTTIELEGPVEIHVADALHFSHRVHHKLTGGLVEQVLWVLGDGATFTTGAGRRGRTELIGTFCGPTATVRIGPDYVVKGALYADRIHIAWPTAIHASTALFPKPRVEISWMNAMNGLSDTATHNITDTVGKAKKIILPGIGIPVAQAHLYEVSRDPCGDGIDESMTFKELGLTSNGTMLFVCEK